MKQAGGVTEIARVTHVMGFNASDSEIFNGENTPHRIGKSARWLSYTSQFKGSILTCTLALGGFDAETSTCRAQVKRKTGWGNIPNAEQYCHKSVESRTKSSSCEIIAACILSRALLPILWWSPSKLLLQASGN